MESPLYNGDFSIFGMIMKILNLICAHKDFEWSDLSEKELDTYFVLTHNEIKTNLPHVLKYEELPDYKNEFWSEMSALMFVYEKMDFDWITINHYRRRLLVPNYNEVYVSYPREFTITMKESYEINHGYGDMELLTDIILKSNLSTDFKTEWVKFLTSKYMICYNMASCPKEVFMDWMSVVRFIINEYKSRLNLNTFEDVKKMVDGRFKNNHLQYRLGGFIAERITNVYFNMYAKQHNNLPIIKNPLHCCDVKLLEDGMTI